MSTNIKQEKAEVVQLTAPAGGWTSNDPVRVGFITGVALEDVASGSTGSVKRNGVADLSAEAIDSLTGSASAIAAGDKIFHTTGTPALNKTSAGVFFGYAMEPVTGGATDTIKILQGGEG